MPPKAAQSSNLAFQILNDMEWLKDTRYHDFTKSVLVVFCLCIDRKKVILKENNMMTRVECSDYGGKLSLGVSICLDVISIEISISTLKKS